MLHQDADNKGDDYQVDKILRYRQTVEDEFLRLSDGILELNQKRLDDATDTDELIARLKM
jgi:hypothetical protein